MYTLPSYDDFLSENNNHCAKLRGNQTAITVFEFLRREDVVIKMIELSDLGYPALEAGVVEVERLAEEGGAEFGLGEHFHNQAVGIMCKAILKPFGYIPTDEKPLYSRYFKTAAVYGRGGTDPAKLVVVKRIAAAGRP